MSTAAMRNERGTKGSRWPVVSVLCLAAVLDAYPVVAVSGHRLEILEAFLLHLLLVFALTLVLSSGRLHAEKDIIHLAFVATLFAGPFGALGAAWLVVRRRARRLNAGREFRADVDEVEQLVQRLRTGRAISLDAAIPVNLINVMRRGALSERLAVLGVVAQNYHPVHRNLISLALRSDSAGVRAQAAALWTSLAARYKARLQAALAVTSSEEDAEARVADIMDCLNSGLIEPGLEAAARDVAISLCRSACVENTGGVLAETLISLLLDAGEHEEAWEEFLSLEEVSSTLHAQCLATFIKEGRQREVGALLGAANLEGALAC